MKTLRLKTYVLILLMVVFSSAGNLFLSMGMKRIGAVEDLEPAALAATFLGAITSGMIWLGIACLLLYFVCNLAVLTWADFSFVRPTTAVGYLFAALLGLLVLHETVPPTRWLGIALICCGVILVGRTRVRTTEAEAQ